MQATALEKAIVNAKYGPGKARMIFFKHEVFSDLIVKANGEFIQSFFEKKFEPNLWERLMNNKVAKSKPYYEYQVLARLVELGLPENNDAFNLIEQLPELRGDLEIPIFDNPIFGRYYKRYYYRFEITRRKNAEDLYVAVRS